MKEQSSMKITKIKVDNFRLLKEFEIDLEDNLSLVIGKNNCGKTSLLTILERFLVGDQNNFSFDDLNIAAQIELKEKIEKKSMKRLIVVIEVILNDFKKKKSKLEEPSDINLFFIEEPEAHTHPQMQYVFIKNIKSLLEEERQDKADGIEIKLQTIINTHSSHITAESDFDDVKY
ncbi:MAG: AAA family ATPase [Bacteroidetes bacterium]|nr:AAA family ATPase [Bacteroidota bacterium]